MDTESENNSPLVQIDLHSLLKEGIPQCRGLDNLDNIQPTVVRFFVDTLVSFSFFISDCIIVISYRRPTNLSAPASEDLIISLDWRRSPFAL